MRDFSVLCLRALREAFAPRRLPVLLLGLVGGLSAVLLGAGAGLGAMLACAVVLAGAFAAGSGAATLVARDRAGLSAAWFRTLPPGPAAHALASIGAAVLVAVPAGALLGSASFGLLSLAGAPAELARVAPREVPAPRIVRPAAGGRPAQDVRLTLPPAKGPDERAVVDLSILYSAASGLEEFVVLERRLDGEAGERVRVAKRDALILPLEARARGLTLHRPEAGAALIVRGVWTEVPGAGPWLDGLRLGFVLGVVAAGAAALAGLLAQAASPATALLAGVGWIVLVSLAAPLASLAAPEEAEGHVRLARGLLDAAGRVLPAETPFEAAAGAAAGRTPRGGFEDQLPGHLAWTLAFALGAALVAQAGAVRARRSGKQR